MANKKVGLSDSEWKILKVLWEHYPLSCRQIENQLKEDTGWTRHDIFSFLKRMEVKGAVHRKEASPHHLYYPILDYQEAVADETRSFLKKLWDGNLGLMVSSMVREEKLGEKEIDELMKSLQEAKKGLGGELK
ncbi:transcriptional regulator, BlaI/MecI/CopY family [Desulfitobacterium hafniense DP7]|uniref:BlaI family transcriptional regulator, penicillinase repressor n=2 Tax=Desulfitobacterium TaxID=36853 RepID=A0A1M7RW52_9FIRM|nr:MULTISPECIES: BlaI/MecI/CopY family transcriptional regulator [Desulfitobacterium]EHL05490.1 transcriptional regulator, BlaI/MecI/CopY family [Desulfitobacterium hafniense DP7]SHN50348.1 BlaI family transcriptional regulator, penicillinase repressor [Desulfitobacterium chlororespirans DSM 11544]